MQESAQKRLDEQLDERERNRECVFALRHAQRGLAPMLLEESPYTFITWGAK